jgi:hypothetical protein
MQMLLTRKLSTSTSHNRRHRSKDTNMSRSLAAAARGHIPVCWQTKKRQFQKLVKGMCLQSLGHWPVQLKLVNPAAPYFREAHLLVAADCVPFAYAGFHRDLLRGRAVAIGCPKLDDAMYYVDKLAEIIRGNNLKSITVAHMEVPCCGGMVSIVREAIKRSGCDVPVKDIRIALDGTVQVKRELVL